MELEDPFAVDGLVVRNRAMTSKLVSARTFCAVVWMALIVVVSLNVLYDSVATDPCEDITCSRHGKCSAGSCICEAGYAGEICAGEVTDAEERREVGTSGLSGVEGLVVPPHASGENAPNSSTPAPRSPPDTFEGWGCSVAGARLRATCAAARHGGARAGSAVLSPR